MFRSLVEFKFQAALCLGTAIVLCAGSIAAQEINTNELSENGWYSDDTRADGSGSEIIGTNLISDTLTDDPEATASGTSTHDADINNQIIFGDAVGAEPVGTYGGAVHLRIAAGSGPGKSQISHRKDDVTGHGPGSGFGPGFTAEYSWMGDGTVSVTASLKFGIKTSEFGSAGTSSRTGENVWDKVLIYEPGNLNGGTSDGLWQTETIDYTTGKWWFFDRVALGSSIGTPVTLSDMSTDLTVFSGAKTLADVYALITAPGAIITSVQFGIGSGNAGGSVYVNEMETSVYRAGMTTTFGMPSPFDQDATPDVIFGSGNANGSFTVDRTDGVELGLRAKLRFPPTNQFNSNGDGTYTFNTGSGTSSPPNPEWGFEWTVNTDYDDSTGDVVGDLTYEIGMDFDPGGGTDYLAFDHITIGEVLPYTPAPPPTISWDHSMGDNSTLNGAGVEAAGDPPYASYLSTFNVAQNSWRMTFFDNPPTEFVFDPDVPGEYDFYLAAFDGATEVARTAITVFAMDGMSLTLEGDPCQTDQDGSKAGIQVAFDLWLRNPDDLDVTGYQAFLAFDDLEMTYEGLCSSYSAGPFESHIQDITTAEVLAGELRLDGNTFGPAHSGDALLATLVFTVTECDSNTIAFDLTQPFDSEASNLGTPYTTDLVDSSAVVGDDTPPVITTNANITQPADAGSCTEAVVTWTDPTATDNCDPSPTVVCVPASGSTFPVGTTTVTCTATDDCGNEDVSTFDVTITATNYVCVVVELPGSMPTTRCIRFVTDSCTTVADIPLTFIDHDASMATPVRFDGMIEVPCGVWTQLCAKDEQHTKWDESLLTVVGAKYVASTTFVLEGGDTDNDGDVDINDVTLFLAQFGLPTSPGGCPWDGVTRDADFDNDTVVGSPDYGFLVANWLTLSGCSCYLPLGGNGRARMEQWAPVHDVYTAAADRNGDGRVDVRDVELFETEHGLSGELSRRMRQ